MKAARILFSSLLILTVAILFGQPAEKWTLEKCIDYAIKNNIAVRQAALTTQTSRNLYRQSGYNLLPQVDVSAGYNFNFGNSLNPVTYSYESGSSQSAQMAMQGSLTLFNGLQQIYNIEKSRYDLLASKFDYENAKDNLSLNVASSFLQILLNKEILGVATQQKNLTAAQKDITGKKVAAGALPESSIYEVEAQLSRDEANEVNDKGNYELSVLALKQLLTLPDTIAFDIDAPEVNVNNQTDIATLTSTGIYAYAVTAQPVIKSAEARWKSADMSRKIAWGNITPTLSAYFNLNTGYASDYQVPASFDTFTFGGHHVSLPTSYENLPVTQQLKSLFRQSAGLSLTVPIFGKLQRFTNIDNAKLTQGMRQLDLDNAKLQLRQTIEQAYENARVAAENYAANKKSFESTTKAYEAVEKRYESGLVTSYDLQQSKNQLRSAESEMIQAKYTYVFRIKILDFYQGRPITLN